MVGKQAGQCGILACLGVVEVPSVTACAVSSGVERALPSGRGSTVTSWRLPSLDQSLASVTGDNTTIPRHPVFLNTPQPSDLHPTLCTRERPSIHSIHAPPRRHTNLKTTHTFTPTPGGTPRRSHPDRNTRKRRQPTATTVTPSQTRTRAHRRHAPREPRTPRARAARPPPI